MDPLRSVNGDSLMSIPRAFVPAARRVRISASPRWPALPVTRMVMLQGRGDGRTCCTAEAVIARRLLRCLLLFSFANLQRRGHRNPGQRRQPEREEAVRQDDHDRHLLRYTEGRVKCRHADLDHGDAAGEKAEAAEEQRYAVAGHED